MAVSKELLARYKELKAQGISITLSELKAQMEDEANSNTTSQAISSIGAEEPTSTNTSTQTTPSLGCASTSSYSEPSPPPQPTPTQNSGWTTSYSQPISSTQIPQASSTESYSGNVSGSFVDNSSYENNFSANFGWNAQVSQTQSVQAQSQISNIPQTMC